MNAALHPVAIDLDIQPMLGMKPRAAAVGFALPVRLLPHFSGSRNRALRDGGA